MKVRVADWLKPWPRSAEGIRWLNIVLAWLWFSFAMYGLSEYIDLVSGPFKSKIADSIPVLFFISVYANFVGHLATAQAARTEEAEEDEADERAR